MRRRFEKGRILLREEVWLGAHGRHDTASLAANVQGNRDLRSHTKSFADANELQRIIVHAVVTARVARTKHLDCATATG